MARTDFSTAELCGNSMRYTMPQKSLIGFLELGFTPSTCSHILFLAGTVIFVLGFSPIIYVLRFPFDILYAGMVHANLNWTFGPFRYIFASPVFHRFRHTKPEEGGERNFAPNFSFIDLLFGTFYMPEGKVPQTFGVIEKVPETFLGQLAYPFRKSTSN